MNIDNKTTREQALEWFNSKASLEKTRLCDTNTEIVGKVRRWETLTGREIELIYLSEHPTQPEQTDDTYIDKLEREIFRTQKQVTKKDIEMEELKEQNKLLREALAEIHGFLKVLPALRLGNKQGFDECVNIEGVKELELLASKALNQ